MQITPTHIFLLWSATLLFHCDGFAESEEYEFSAQSQALTLDGKGTLNNKLSDSPIASQKKKLKILIVTQQFPFRPQIMIVNQIAGLLDLGHDVSIYSYKNSSHSLHESLIKYRGIAKIHYGKLPSDITTYDFIICQFGDLGEKFVKIKRKHNLRAKLITCFRGADITRKYKYLSKYGDFFLPVCASFRKRLISLGFPSEKIRVHYSSIDCSRFSLSEHKLDQDGIVHLVTVTRLIQKKGIEDALKAVREVVQYFPKITYTIIGDGPLMPKLRRLARTLGLADKVVFVGWKSPAEVAQYLANAHIFILPCVSMKHNIDGIPNALKEAMACGLPVISTMVSGIPEIVKDGINGLLVKQHDPHGLAQKIRFLIDYPEVGKAYGLNGRAIMEQKFDVSKVREDLESILLNLS